MHHSAAMEVSQEAPLMMSSHNSEASSPEFEFWSMEGVNCSLPQMSLITADELFVDGVLLPLHLLSLSHPNPTPAQPPPEIHVEQPPPPPPPTNRSKKWKDETRERRTKERRGSAGGAAELNINIWPFSRSRSAGNAAAGSWTRARAAVAVRKVSSAPCSRSNSRGESSKPASSSSSRRWAPAASRVSAFAGGIHLGRMNPVWKIHKKVNQPVDADDGEACAGAKKGGGNAGGVRVLNFHVNTCIGYRNRMVAATAAAGGGGRGGVKAGGSSGGSLLKLRAIFSKNVY